MDWRFRWVSSFRNDFNYDFNVSFTQEQRASGKAFHNFDMIENTMEEAPGTSVFAMDRDGGVFHTYSAYGRGDEPVLGAYAYLDMTPKGRNENGPNYNLMDWVRRHDEYPA
jgi:predicted dithiol-disulfide oxidoreductase (DUF899 family)